MEYVTHLREDGSYQPLKEHLEGTATRSAKFAASFGSSSHAERTALLHDIGKYSPNGQRRQRDPEHTAKLDHSTAGAKAAADLDDMHAAFAIAGHHGGLPDLGTRLSLDDGTLCARLNKKLTGGDDPSAWRSEISLPTGVQLTPPWLPRNDVRLTAMYIRMLFSCLVDADFLDTERALNEKEMPRGIGDSMPALLEKLQALAFALSHAVKHDMKRIIYVIPYTSIIDQNAKVFREILGDENVVEHHSQVDLPDTDAETPDALRKRLACENWDAPVIVTTAVQFFESFYAAKPGRCRKLHNVANSVVIFDEAQTLPISLMRPCVSVIDQLVQHYGVTAVLCTATQPELLSIFSGFTAGTRIQELVPDPDALFSSLRRVTFQQDGTLSDEELAARIRQENAVLCIVNSRKQARSLYEALPEEGRFHLSTLMNAIDRERTIATIRERLDKKQCCRVISTSLIEAGVDVDFPTVYRELAGLDSILQAAGRCNREGKEAAQDSIVHIYQTEHAVPPIMRPNIESCRTVLRLYAEDIGSRKAIHAYFCDLLFKRGENQQRSRPVSSENDLLDTSKTLSSEARFAFRETAEHFRFIDTDTVTVYIPTPENSEDIKALRDGHYSRELFRRLGRCGVSIYRREYQALCSIGGVTEIADAHCGILSDIKLYTPECGLQVSCTSGLALFS